MSEDRILQALRALAERDQELEATPQTEALLVREFRRRRMQRGRQGSAIGMAIGAVAAGVAIVAFLMTSNPQVRQPQGSLSTSVPAVSPNIAAPPVIVATPPKPSRRFAAAKPAPPREIVTEFFPLMDPAPPFDRGQMLRVRLPAAAMRSVGLPVGEDHLADPIQADVLVGEKGMPRAIRFVRFDSQ